MVESDAIEPFYYQTHDSLMLFLGELVSISQTFYKQLLGKKVLCAAFLYSQFVFVFFFGKTKLGENAARKILVKLTTDLSNVLIKTALALNVYSTSFDVRTTTNTTTTTSSTLFIHIENVTRI